MKLSKEAIKALTILANRNDNCQRKYWRSIMAFSSSQYEAVEYTCFVCNKTITLEFCNSMKADNLAVEHGLLHLKEYNLLSLI